MYDDRSLQELYHVNPYVRAIVDFYGKRSRTRDGSLKSMRLEMRKNASCRFTIEELDEAVKRLEVTGCLTVDNQ